MKIITKYKGEDQDDLGTTTRVNQGYPLSCNPLSETVKAKFKYLS